MVVTKPTKKPKAPPSPTHYATYNEGFTIGGCTCEIISVHGKFEQKIDTKTMRERGETAGADMTRDDGEFLLKYRKDIPAAYFGIAFLFPKWTSEANTVNDGKIRAIDSRGVTWWCKQKFPNMETWDSKFKLVRFSKLRLA